MITADDWKGEYRDIRYEISAENKVSKPFLKVLFYVYDIEMDEYLPADDEDIAHHGYSYTLKQAHQVAKSLIDEKLGED